MITSIIDLFLHLDKYLINIISEYGMFVYLIIFIIIFLETGIVITPFLPGDSLLFIAGALAAIGSLNVWLLVILVSVAAIIGDSVNYSIGNFLGVKVFENSRFFKKEYLLKTQEFYKKHGGKTIILSRFVPIIRTFAPFVAGISKMNYQKFLTYNIVGGIVWALLFIFLGFFFGNIPLIRDNITLFALLIVILSILPAVFEYLRQKMKQI